MTPEFLIANVTLFLLAIFLGFELITKVPATLHTPLMRFLGLVLLELLSVLMSSMMEEILYYLEYLLLLLLF